MYLTGGLRLEGPSGSLEESDLPGHQGRVAFVALAIERVAVSSDRLADIVWDSRPPAQARNGLAAIISKIRSLLTSVGLDGRSVLTTAGGTFTFSPPPDMWIDMEHGLRSLDRAEGALRHGEPRQAAVEATIASAILRRPLLAGDDCLWLDVTRGRQTDALYRTFVVLSGSWNQLGDHQLAAVTAESAISLDPFRELGHRLLIEAERARGDSGSALRAFQRCTRDLAEIGATPSPETVALVGDMQRGD